MHQKHIIVPLPAAAMVLKQQAAAARTLHGAAGNRQRLLDAANREKDQLVKALVGPQSSRFCLLRLLLCNPFLPFSTICLPAGRHL